MAGPLDEILAPPPAPAAPSFRYGTVTGTNPLRVRLDGDTNPVASTPATIAAVAAGDRVLVMIYHRRMVILGQVGGNQHVATGRRTGTTWDGYFEVARVGATRGVLSGWFKRTSTNLAVSPSAELTSTGLNPNSVLPPWAQIQRVGAGGSTALHVAVVSGDGVNTSIHVAVTPGSSNISFRAQSAFTWTTSVVCWLPAISVELAG